MVQETQREWMLSAEKVTKGQVRHSFFYGFFKGGNLYQLHTMLDQAEFSLNASIRSLTSG